MSAARRHLGILLGAMVLTAPLAAQRLVLDIAKGPAGSSPSEIVEVEGTGFFAADDRVHGRELWRSDGTAQGTRLVLDLRPGVLGSFPVGLTPLGRRLVFFASTATTGHEPYVTDGTATGTRLLRDVNPGPAGSVSSKVRPVAHAGRVYFAATDGRSGTELWTTDGTAAGTRQVADLNRGPNASLPESLTPLGARLFFTAFDGIVGRELFVTDGVRATLVKDVWPGSRSGWPRGLTAAGGKLFFSASTPAEAEELWVSDGTPKGTKLVKDIMAGFSGSRPKYLTELRGKVVFFADDRTHGFEPWVSDGTPQGTFLLKDISVNCGSCQGEPIYEAGDLVVFLAFDAAGKEPWTTDGTSAGTRRIKDLTPGRAFTKLTDAGPAGDGPRLLLSAGDWSVRGGPEPWITDGTSAGTRKLADLNPAAGSFPDGFRTIGDVVLFHADDGTHGRELFALPLATTGGTLARAYGRGCPGSNGRSPALFAVGLPTLGNGGFAAGVRDARAAAFGTLLAGARRAAAPLGSGCTLLVSAPAIPAVDLRTDAAGRARVALPVPNDPGLLGGGLTLQLAVVDPGGALLGVAAVSNGLHLVVGR